LATFISKFPPIHQELSGKTDTIPYDKLVLSMGAFPIVPPLPGLTGNPKVVTLRNMDDMRNIKARVQDDKVKNVVVLGAGFIGVEMVPIIQCCLTYTGSFQ
jgi:NADPH-dependent 2,4-dienoyl-CoA reductase/sulfur reductase-like enzyme